MRVRISSSLYPSKPCLLAVDTVLGWWQWLPLLLFSLVHRRGTASDDIRGMGFPLEKIHKEVIQPSN